jgi:hypothetical protein
MNFQKYRELCRAASHSLNLEDLEQLGNEGFLEKEGIRIALIFDEDIVSDRLFCYVDLGPITDECRIRTFERLLMLNLLSGTKTSGVYTIDPASGNAVFCVHLMNPDRLQGEDLAEMLTAYVGRAIQLQKTLLNDIDDLDFMDTVNHIFAMDDVYSPSEIA